MRISSKCSSRASVSARCSQTSPTWRLRISRRACCLPPDAPISHGWWRDLVAGCPAAALPGGLDIGNLWCGRPRGALMNLAHGILKRNRLRGLSLGLVVCANVVELLQLFFDLLPFGERQHYGCSVARFVDQVLFLRSDHCTDCPYTTPAAWRPGIGRGRVLFARNGTCSDRCAESARQPDRADPAACVGDRICRFQEAPNTSSESRMPT
jgi:hypothetical protein